MMIVAGHEDSNVANKLRHDSSFRLAFGAGSRDRSCAVLLIHNLTHGKHGRYAQSYQDGARGAVFTAIPSNARPGRSCRISTTPLMLFAASSNCVCSVPATTNLASNPYWSLTSGASGGFSVAFGTSPERKRVCCSHPTPDPGFSRWPDAGIK